MLDTIYFWILKFPSKVQGILKTGFLDRKEEWKIKKKIECFRQNGMYFLLHRILILIPPLLVKHISSLYFLFVFSFFKWLNFFSCYCFYHSSSFLIFFHFGLICWQPHHLCMLRINFPQIDLKQNVWMSKLKIISFPSLRTGFDYGF